MIHSSLKKNYRHMGAPQENDAKFKFAIHPQGIRQFYDNCKLAKCQTVATLASVYIVSNFLRGGGHAPEPLAKASLRRAMQIPPLF